MGFRTRSLIGPWRVVSSAAALLLFMVGSAQGQSMMTRQTRREVTSGQAKFVSRLPGTQILRLDIVLPLRDQAGLEAGHEAAQPGARRSSKPGRDVATGP